MSEKTISCINSNRGCKVVFTTLRSMEIHSTSMRCIGSAIFNQIRRFKKVCWVCSKPYDRKYFDRHVCVQSRNGRAPPQPRIVQNRHRVIRETPAEIVINTSRNVVIVNGRYPADKSNMRRWARGPEREENRHFRETARVVSTSERVRERERCRDQNRERHRDNRIVSYRRERGQRHDLRNVLVEKRNRSDSLSPGQELPRDNAPPLRLIDDLFRKTTSQPCIYWLPQTPEQIALREATRQKQLAEQHEQTNASEVGRVERAFSRWGP